MQARIQEVSSISNGIERFYLELSIILNQVLIVIFPLGEVKVNCIDTDNGATDKVGDSCASNYNDNPGDCGKYDEDGFTANSMCCACKGICYFYATGFLEIIGTFQSNLIE